MLGGILVGYILRKSTRYNYSFGIPLVFIICLLLFLMGVDLGYNEQLIPRITVGGGSLSFTARRVPQVGSKMIALLVTSFIVTIVVLAVTILNATWFQKFFVSRRGSGKADAREQNGGNSIGGEYAESAHRSFKEKIMAWKDTFFILGSFVLGIVAALNNIIPSSWAIKDFSMYTLYILIVIVGLSVGTDRKILQTIKGLSPKLLLLPALTIVSTIIGGFCAYAVIRGVSFTIYVDKINLVDSLGVSCGLGYYSLSSLMLNEIRGAEIGTIALASNILRELLTILLAPVLAKRLTPLAPISCGGATTGDSTLPALQKACGNEYVPLSILHGISVDFCVPFLVTLVSSFY